MRVITMRECGDFLEVPDYHETTRLFEHQEEE